MYKKAPWIILKTLLLKFLRHTYYAKIIDSLLLKLFPADAHFTHDITGQKEHGPPGRHRYPSSMAGEGGYAQEILFAEQEGAPEKHEWRIAPKLEEARLLGQEMLRVLIDYGCGVLLAMHLVVGIDFIAENN